MGNRNLEVLHITNWYPSKHFPCEALWIKRQIDSLPSDVENTIYHIEIFNGSFKLKVNSDHKNHRSYLIWLPFQVWRINEILLSLILIYILFVRERRKKYDILNFHIGYPILTYLHIIKKFISIPVVISEHWSAYHFNFNIEGHKLNRIKRIFRQGIPIFTVSKALGEDIMKFSNGKFKNFIVPNVVDLKTFNSYGEKPKKCDPYFLMVSQWKEPKLPLVAIKSFKLLTKETPDVYLKIAGYGPLMDRMYREANGFNNIQFIGSLDAVQIARYMRGAIALIHPSNYETFSVVCAEAVSCRCPVIASKVGGIPEFINHNNGFLVASNQPDEFLSAMRKCMSYTPKFSSVPDFSRDTIGEKYFNALLEISNGIEK